MPCKLCGANRELVKAHIVPEAFFRVGRGPGDTALIMASSDPETPPKRRPIGVYDPELVCGECENRFQGWDAYAADLFINRLDEIFTPRVVDGDTIGFVANDVDYPRLKLFIISLLWRASASTQEFFGQVRLGPYEEHARAAVVSANPGMPQDFGTVFSRWVAPPDLQGLTNAHMSPFRERWNGINMIRMYLGQVVAYVKVDQRPFTEPFVRALLRPQQPLCLMARAIHGSKDLRAMGPVIENLERWQR